MPGPDNSMPIGAIPIVTAASLQEHIGLVWKCMGISE